MPHSERPFAYTDRVIAALAALERAGLRYEDVTVGDLRRQDPTISGWSRKHWHGASPEQRRRHSQDVAGSPLDKHT